MRPASWLALAIMIAACGITFAIIAYMIRTLEKFVP